MEAFIWDLTASNTSTASPEIFLMPTDSSNKKLAWQSLVSETISHSLCLLYINFIGFHFESKFLLFQVNAKKKKENSSSSAKTFKQKKKR